MSDCEKSGKMYSAYDEQRKKLEKLMMDPEKPAYIPSIPKEQKPREPREFIRNIWGSSAGVGSGDFHIYRGIRRRQMEREEYMEKNTERERLNEEYSKKRQLLEDESEAQTSKKRMKRQRKKQNKINKKVKVETTVTKSENVEDHSDDSGSNPDDDKIPDTKELPKTD